MLAVPLNAKATAALIGRSPNTLLRARHERVDLRMPPWRRFGTRGVVYMLGDVLAWGVRREVALNWGALPFSFALASADAFDAAGLDIPADLQSTLDRVRHGRRGSGNGA